MQIVPERQKLPPIPDCQGCPRYHGVAYFGVALYCPLHPKGWAWTNAPCPDKPLKI